MPNLFTHHYLYLYCDFHQIFSCPLLPVSLTFASASPSCLKKLRLSNDDDDDDNVDDDDHDNEHYDDDHDYDHNNDHNDNDDDYKKYS